MRFFPIPVLMLQPEPSEEYVARPLELDADMEIVTPMKPVFGDGDSSQSLSMSMMQWVCEGSLYVYIIQW